MNKLDSNDAPIGYIAKDNDPLYPDRHPCAECDFHHIRLIDCGYGCKNHLVIEQLVVVHLPGRINTQFILRKGRRTYE